MCFFLFIIFLSKLKDGASSSSEWSNKLITIAKRRMIFLWPQENPIGKNKESRVEFLLSRRRSFLHKQTLEAACSPVQKSWSVKELFLTLMWRLPFTSRRVLHFAMSGSVPRSAQLATLHANRSWCLFLQGIHRFGSPFRLWQVIRWSTAAVINLTHRLDGIAWDCSWKRGTHLGLRPSATPLLVVSGEAGKKCKSLH